MFPRLVLVSPRDGPSRRSNILKIGAGGSGWRQFWRLDGMARRNFCTIARPALADLKTPPEAERRRATNATDRVTANAVSQ